MCTGNTIYNQTKLLLGEFKKLREDADSCLDKINAATNPEDRDFFLPEFIRIHERGEKLLIEGKKWEASQNNRKARRMAGSQKIIRMHLLLKEHGKRVGG